MAAAVVLCGIFFFPLQTYAQWSPQVSGAPVRLRGLSAVSDRVAWASGEKGTYTRTTDGGATWHSAQVPGAEALDFRDVVAFSSSVAYLMSTGKGELSRIYKTTDGGAHWSLQFTCREAEAFFDAMAFWDADHGIALSDPVRGHFLLITTSDGGRSWTVLEPEAMPAALPGEGAFAASGTCITVLGKNDVWFGTGGAAQARVFHSRDRGRTWSVAVTPVVAGAPAAGIFSLAFRDAKNGIAVGGNYMRENDATGNIARTADGGTTWTMVKGPRPGGYRSAVAYTRGRPGPVVIATGPNGSDYSTDDGLTWTSLGGPGYDTLSFAGTTATGWAAGDKGRIAKFNELSVR